MKNFKLFVSLILAVMMLMVGVVSFAETTSTEEIPLVRISLDEWIGWKSLIDANGGLKTAPGSLYSLAGLNIEFVPMNDATMSSTALINGELSAAGYTVNRYAFLQDRFDGVGLDVVMPFITNYSNGGDGIIATSDIKSVKDLAGKKIAVPRFSEAQTLVEWLIRNSSLTESEQNAIRDSMVYCETADDAARMFFSGSVDAAATWEPYLTQAKNSTESGILFSTAMSTNLILDGLVFRQDFLDANPDFLPKLIDNALEASKMYKTEFTYIREMPMFELMTDEEIIDMANGANLCTWADNRDLLTGVACTVYRDMADIWNGIGEVAYPEKANEAFTDEYVLKLSDKYEAMVQQTADTNFTDENRLLAFEADNEDALLGYNLDIKFRLNSWEINQESYKELDQFVEIAKVLNNAYIQIEGNASIRSRGVTDAQIVEFALGRAEAVASYFESKGIAAERIITASNGDSNPIADNTTEKGRAANRRTDIYFKVVVGY